MTIVHINYQSDDNVRALPWDKNTLGNPATLRSNGAYPLSLKDENGADAGIVFEEISATAVGSGGGVDPATPIPEGYSALPLRGTWYSAGIATYRYSNFLPNQAVIVEVMAWHPTRSTTVAVNGVSQLYTGGSVANPPLVFNAIADANGIIDLTTELVAGGFYGYLSTVILTFDNVKRVTPTQSNYTFGDRIAWSLLNIDTITEARLIDLNDNEITLTGLTQTGADMPALSPNADLVLLGECRLVVDNATGSAEGVVNIVAPSGYSSVTSTSVATTLTAKDWGFGLDVPAAIGDQILFLTSDNSIITHNNDFTSNAVGAGTTTFFLLQAMTGGASSITKVLQASVGTVDTTAPIITVSGPATQTVAFGSAEPSFTSSTDDGSAIVFSNGGYNGQSSGSYTFTFNATDAAGNVATQVTRTVIVAAEVIATPAPTVSIATIGTLTDGDTGTATATTTNTNSLAWSATGAVSINASTGAYTVSSAGAWTITATATGDGGSTSNTINGTAQAAPVVPSELSDITLRLSGIPDGNYFTRVINPATNTVVFNNTAAWVNGSLVLTNIPTPAGSLVEYYAHDGYDGGLDTGVTL